MLLEELEGTLIGRVGRDVDWIWTSLMEGLEGTLLMEGMLDSDFVDGRVGRDVVDGRIGSVLLLLIVPIDAVVVDDDCSDRRC